MLELELSCGELAIFGFLLVATWAYVPDRGLLLIFRTGASDGSFDLSFRIAPNTISERSRMAPKVYS